VAVGHPVGTLIYWQLLAALGRKDEARELARSFPRPPASSVETVRLAETYVVLDLRDERGSSCNSAFSNSAIQRKSGCSRPTAGGGPQWEELRELALQLRQHPAVPDTLVGYSHYCKAAPSWAGSTRRRGNIFQKSAQRPFEDRALGLTTASSLLKLGYPAIARDILLPLEPAWRPAPSIGRRCSRQPTH